MPPQQPLQQASQPSTATASEIAASEALQIYQAAEKAINACAHESLYGPYNRIYYKVEEKVAREKEIGWRDRGPRGENKPDFWKSQKWRPNAKRYANRGGKNRDHFKQKYGVPMHQSSSSTGE
jgi:hypothetical protein